MMDGWPLKYDGPCACRFVRREEFGETEQTEWCGLHARHRDEIDRLRDTLRGIAEADWKKWEELASPEEFVRWAKSRANHALQAPNE